MKFEDIAAMAKKAKPWFVPAWIWNKTVNLACDALKGAVDINAAADLVSNAICGAVTKAVDSKDEDKVKSVCTTVACAGTACTAIANAAADGRLTDDERAMVSESISDMARSIITQERLDGIVESAREALLIS